MNYNPIGKKKNIRKVICFNKGLVFSTLGGDLFFNDIILITNIDGSSIFRLSDNVIQIYDNMEGYYYLSESVIKSNYFFHFGYNTKNIIATTQPKRVSLGVYKKDVILLKEDLKTTKEIILKNVEYNLIAYTQHELIFSLKNKLLAYSYINQLLWEFLIEGNHNFLGIFENDLLVILDDSSILRIDIETGDLKEHFKITLFADTENEVIAQYNFIQFQGDKLIYYRYGQYAEYDLVRNKITYDFDIREELTTQKLHDNIDSYIKEGDVLYYYISGFGSFSLPSIVVLNIRTKEILWKYIWDNPDVFYKDFQKSETALYLLDSENTLHIFEKE